MSIYCFSVAAFAIGYPICTLIALAIFGIHQHSEFKYGRSPFDGKKWIFFKQGSNQIRYCEKTGQLQYLDFDGWCSLASKEDEITTKKELGIT